MNRQQRRQLARQQEAQAVHFRELQKRQTQIDDHVAVLHMVAYALALSNAGYDENVIEKIILSANDIISSIDGDTVNLWTLAAELEKKTGIEIRIKRE